MKAAVVRSFDAPPRYAEFDLPVAGDGEKIVTVTAAGLHPIVKALASGTHYSSTGQLPFVPGVDGVGRLADGSRVYFGVSRPPFGTFAEHAPAPDWLTVPLPEQLDDATAAGIVNPAMSSWVALTARAKFTARESVLVLGATGVAGQLAVQIARRRGAGRVVAAGRNPRALDRLKELGANVVISLDQERDALVEALRAEIDGGIDVVLDYLWGAPAEAVFDAVAKKGRARKALPIRYVQIGNSAGATITLPAAALRNSGLELLGSGFGSASLDEIARAIATFFSLMAERPLDFRVKTAKLCEVEATWNAPAEGARLVFQP